MMIVVGASAATGSAADQSQDKARLQALEAESRALQQRLSAAESALQLSRAQSKELANAAGQEAGQLRDNLTQQEVKKNCWCIKVVDA